MFGADKRYLSFSLSDGVIKLAQVKSSGNVEKVTRISVVDPSQEALGQSLKTILNGFDKKAPVICTIPVSSSTSKTIEVPSSDPQEIKSIINLQVSRHTPYSREEVLVGYVNLGQGAVNHTKVLLVIVHRNVVKDRLAVLEKASLNVEKILFVPEGMGRLYSKGLNLKKESDPVGVIDITQLSVNFLVVARGSIIFCRSIPIGMNLLVEGSKTTTMLLDEINKSVESYNSEDNSLPVSKFHLTTEHELVKTIVPALKEGLRAEVVVTPYANFVKAAAVKSKLEKDFADDSFLDVISPVVGVSKCEVNLMPEEMIAKKTVERQSKEAIKTVIAALLILLLLGGAIMSNIYFKDAYLNQNLKAQFASQKEEVQRLQEGLNKIKVVKKYLQGRMVSLEILRGLYKVTPNKIYLNTISFDEDDTLTITGLSPSALSYSDSMAQVNAYEKALTASPMFKDVKTSTTTKKDNGKDIVSFEIKLKVEESSKES
ncbi:MAG: pilus assembly protein PilM [Candidatus Omnitrophica bacterium]|nr:pilus assembly protein PilM [Candidatus Omnitrophota bacterium]